MGNAPPEPVRNDFGSLKDIVKVTTTVTAAAAIAYTLYKLYESDSNEEEEEEEDQLNNYKIKPPKKHTYSSSSISDSSSSADSESDSDDESQSNINRLKLKKKSNIHHNINHNCSSGGRKSGANSEQRSNNESVKSILSRLDSPVESDGAWQPTSQFKGEKSFGYFKCNKCKREWPSAHAWKNSDQECKTCRTKCKPIGMWCNFGRNARPKPDGDNGRPHEQSLCGKCKELDRPCWTLSKSY
jgi:hypothetical protein